MRTTTKLKRNERCPCGSGRKFKHCCLRKVKHGPVRFARLLKPLAEEADVVGKMKQVEGIMSREDQ